jgi:L-proline 4-hydroxylase
MRLTTDQLKHYKEAGFLLLPECFSTDEVARMKSQLNPIFSKDSPRRVVEKEGGIVRSVYGSHNDNEVFRRLSCHPRIVEPSRQIIGSDVYVYQFKINAKAAFGGDVWEWHQDFVFWRKEDGLPSARVINTVVFLDEVNDYNGPIFLIPGSHKEGIIDVPAYVAAGDGKQAAPYMSSPAWIANLTAKLKYSVERETVARLVEKNGIAAPKGPAGSVLFFDSNAVHASPSNISPFDRVVVIVTFNSVENIPTKVENRRPDFLVSRNYEPVSPVGDDALFV